MTMQGGSIYVSSTTQVAPGIIPAATSTKLGQTVIAGADSSTLEISGLGAYQSYQVLVDYIMTSNQNIYMNFNDDATASHYGYTKIMAADTVLTSIGVENDTKIDCGLVSYGARSLLTGIISCRDITKPKGINCMNGSANDSGALTQIHGIWKDTANQLTKISLTQSSDKKFVIGSAITVWGLA
jgi:hypothetical protein